MHDLALYRKYRPKNFKEVLGQDHIVKILESSVETNKVSHAYLFVGTRGTGKTSVARIFAMSIGVSANDMYEIDAASNRGIEDIKELRDGARVLPFDSKYKVYIIDEVHMLSKDAWGALLKTLEEPPKHVIFILATTELQKVPETIISRCQVFTFKKASDAICKKMLLDVAKKENFEMDAGSAELLAILADGSFRDALGELQKVLN
ncbi:MAG: DNA polymerase III subunit gamma/tau, partial [Candidatus Parcubacteria bacterium]|nr:DNA polymerase III subunit gamma/tau [Candidatus Parcubacteria bacterium]